MKNATAIRRPDFAACRRRAYIQTHRCIFPNAAGTRYFLERLLDGVLAAATTMGLVVMVIFLFTVF
jgi:hypothetical protein